MELEDLKSAWAQYDRKLSENLKLNEELLRSINFEKYNNALKKPFNLELLNIFIQFLMFGTMTYFAISLLKEIQYFLTGITGALLCFLSLVLSVVKVRRFNKLFYYNMNIVNFQKNFSLLRILIIRLRKIEYILAALMSITVFPVLIKATSGINIFGNLTLLIAGIFIVLGLGYSLGTWLNIVVYDKGIKEAEGFLSMVDKFGKEA